MPNELKSNTVKNFDNIISRFNGLFTNKLRSSHHLKFQNHKEFKDALKLKEHQELKKFEWMLDFHCMKLYELKNHHLLIGFNIPSQFEDEYDLWINTTLYVSYISKYDFINDNASREFNLLEFKNILNHFEKFINHINEKNIVNNNLSKHDTYYHYFNSLFCAKSTDIQQFYDFVNNNEDFLELLNKKSVYANRRAQKNREKKKNKSLLKNHPTIKSNNAKINELENEIDILKRQIALLKQENINLQTVDYDDGHQKSLNELKFEYQKQGKRVLHNLYQKQVFKNNIDLFQLLIEE